MFQFSMEVFFYFLNYTSINVLAILILKYT